MFRLLVTGGRDAPEAECVWVPMWMLLHQHRSIMVTHGACPTGVDLYAHEWFHLPEQAFNRPTRKYEPRIEYLALEDPHPANWKQGGAIAGHIRNQQMVDGHITGQDEPSPIDVCYAWPTPASSGTLDCMARAWVRGIPVYVWHYLNVGRYHRLDDDMGERLARERLGWGRSA
jgi:hypothetical protein